MAKNTEKEPTAPAQVPEPTAPAQIPEATTPAQVPDINEVDGEPIHHAPDEEGDGDSE